MDLDRDIQPPEAGAGPGSAMSAIAKVDSLLELLPMSDDVKLILERVLPVYDPEDGMSDGEESEYFLSISTPASKAEVMADIPAPEPQIDEGWREVVGLEFQGRSARAGAVVSLRVWKAVVDYASLEGIDFGGEVDFRGFCEGEQVSAIGKVVAEAVLRYLQDGPVSNITADLLRLDRGRAVRWTGMALVQMKSEKSGSGLGKEEFVGRWKDLLPEVWRPVRPL
jgi:Sister chromatid cohesion protein Dcc1